MALPAVSCSNCAGIKLQDKNFAMSNDTRLTTSKDDTASNTDARVLRISSTNNPKPLATAENGRTFTRFLELPPELRIIIWKIYLNDCPRSYATVWPRKRNAYQNFWSFEVGVNGPVYAPLKFQELLRIRKKSFQSLLVKPPDEVTAVSSSDIRLCGKLWTQFNFEEGRISLGPGVLYHLPKLALHLQLHRIRYFSISTLGITNNFLVHQSCEALRSFCPKLCEVTFIVGRAIYPWPGTAIAAFTPLPIDSNLVDFVHYWKQRNWVKSREKKARIATIFSGCELFIEYGEFLKGAVSSYKQLHLKWNVRFHVALPMRQVLTTGMYHIRWYCPALSSNWYDRSVADGNGKAFSRYDGIERLFDDGLEGERKIQSGAQRGEPVTLHRDSLLRVVERSNSLPL